MTPDEDFWDDLLAHLREQVLVPVVGPRAVLVGHGDEHRPLVDLIAQRLAQRQGLAPEVAAEGLDATVRAVLRDKGRDRQERLYRIVNDLLVELAPAPPAALRQLASITDLRLFVSTTFDRLLAQAIDAERFGGVARTQEYAFAPNQSTESQQHNAQPPGADPVVFKLFGEASSLPQYAIHDEDTLEWLHALLSESARLPDWVERPLKEQPLLLLGCRLPDWVGRFLVRLASTTRLSMGQKQFFIVGDDLADNSELAGFFHTFCSPSSVQVAQMPPAEFITQLRQRWLAKRLASGLSDHLDEASAPETVASRGSIFISYVREDVAAAERLARAITDLGGDVWLDRRRLMPGDAWEPEILSSIRRGIRLFVPLISQHTEAREEGYVFKEWGEAVERAKGIPSRRFIVPVVIDPECSGDPLRYGKVPEPFLRLHFGRAPAGVPGDDLLATLRDEIRAMRRGAPS
jgi:TIR domain/SIR2-like domain